MKTKGFLALLITVLVISLDVSSMALTSNEKSEKYSVAIAEFETYLQTTEPNENTLNSIIGIFSELENYSQSQSMKYYAQILLQVELGEFGQQTDVYLVMLEKNSAFADYLESELSGSPIRPVSELISYVNGRKAEFNGDIKTAVTCYGNSLGFYDSADRYLNSVSGSYQAIYEHAMELFNQKKLAEAYLQFQTIDGYADSSNYLAAIPIVLGYTPTVGATEPTITEPVSTVQEAVADKVQETTTVYISTSNAAIMRARPDPDADKITTIDGYASCKSYGEVPGEGSSTNTWHKIEYNGKIGYVSSTRISTSKPSKASSNTKAPAETATPKPAATATPKAVVTMAPVTAAPVTAAPVTAAPVTAAPVTAAPVTAAPKTIYYSYQDTSTVEEWSSWSSWQEDSVSASSTVQVEKGTQYHYWAAQCKNCGTCRLDWGSNIKCKNCGKPMPRENMNSLNKFYVNDGTSGNRIIDGITYKLADKKTVYRYRTLTTKTVTSDWSSWSTSRPADQPGRNIRTKEE